MERKNFLKSLMIGAVSTSVLAEACKKDADVATTTTSTSGSSSSGSGSSGSTNTGSCSVAPTETEGPYPTHSPASYVRSDITDGRTGYKLTAKITINNSNNSCNALSGALVDIWHCDAAGNYSEYGAVARNQPTILLYTFYVAGKQRIPTDW